ncbi:MAG TPA: ankyrin repeat domain-containing protein [Pirellulales bacterium]|jgi:ankyrin repeat protein|nr:ankyrin repeat domain-containing protein [Pirellulales bacterium]
MRIGEFIRLWRALLPHLFRRSYYYVNAAMRGDVAGVQRHLNSGVPVDVQSLGNMTAMRWACFNGHAEVVRVLLAHGADPSGGVLEARQLHRHDILTMLQAAGAKDTERKG